MIPLVKIYTRHFHVTSNIFLRRITPKIPSNDHKQEFSESNFNSSSNCQGSCPDYLGVESDENIITIKPQKHQYNPSEMYDNREKFFRASFGVIRFDADNKPKYHGQYKKSENFTFPYTSSEFAKVRNISQSPSYKNQICQNLPLENSQKVLDAEKSSVDINSIDDCYFGKSETQNNTQSNTSEELNYLEKDYFENLVPLKNSSLEQNTSEFNSSKENIDSAFCSENKIEELNYLEKDYFRTLTNLESQNERNTSDYNNIAEKDISNVYNTNQSEELNYLEKSYFEGLNKSENHANQNIQQPISEELNFFEKDYFEDFISSKSPSSEQNTSKYTSSKEEVGSFSNESSTEEINYLEKDYFKISANLENQHKQESKDYINSKKEISNACDTNQSEENPGLIKKSTYTGESVNELIQEKTYEVNVTKLSSNHLQKNNIMSRKNIQPSVEKSNISEKLYNDSVKSLSIENHFKFSKVIPDKSNQNDEMPTAHDFVKNLREEQKVPNQIHISKGKKSDEKLDSKGFRILKDQVTDLSHLTRDEIINLLKQNVVYSDDDLLVLNKPYGLIMHDSQTTKKEPCLSTFLEKLAHEMDHKLSNPKLFTVHRLDKETTGCLLLARNETMAMHLKALFAQRKIVKKYWIITAGVPDPLEGIIDMPISEGSINNRKRMVLQPKLPDDIHYKNHSKNGRPAVTTYKVISQSGNAALVEVFPKTGVKHQIRVHFGFGLGCPVLGDHKYSHLDKLAPQKLPSDMLQRLHVRQSKVRHIPMHIHAKSVGIPEYFDKRDLFVNIPIPDYFKLNLKRLKFRKKDMTY